ncbi:HPr family phosphocarrier protein [Vallitalea longa]|uniref:HPr family phosphocarrier protein n=1 Tax=Vallitalea longa TaxID=2936439 RepID=UPI002491BEBD|nr:HPr family phosphocarrier protein [Vallitalea longa]
MKYDFHARPCAYFVNQASKFQSSITIIAEDKSVNAKSIISVLTSELVKDDRIKIIIDGIDENKAMQKLMHLIQDPLEKDW